MPTPTLHCHLHESGTIRGREHISGTHHLEQTNIKKEANVRGRELNDNIGATNIIGSANLYKHYNLYNSGWDLGSTKEGAGGEWEGVLAEDAGVRGRE